MKKAKKICDYCCKTVKTKRLQIVGVVLWFCANCAFMYYSSPYRKDYLSRKDFLKVRGFIIKPVDRSVSQ